VAILPNVLSLLVTSVAAVFYLKFARRGNGKGSRGDGRAHRFLVVIPAHDEQMSIAKTVRSCLAVDYPRDCFEVLVIADNCDDCTAVRAEEAGARVVERSDASRRSKGHAIEYLIEKLDRSGELNALDALVVVDADSTVAPNLLEEFSLGLERGFEWMQCYDCVGNAEATWRTRLMAYGMALFNGISLAGRQALGLSGGLRGNGMCISVAGLKRVPWNARGLVEDQEYSWNVRIAGGRIDFIKDTAVFATMLRAGGAPLANQRRRWEFGRGDVRRKMLGPLLNSPHVSMREKVAAVVEISHPGPRRKSALCIWS
jgi:cellulose synthase/poly-beta-1,6-N-acetylglucosamine synthase-like glycosyltransferase